MRINGMMFVCNRCGRQVFAERYNDGEFDWKALQGWETGLGSFFSVGELCPECREEYAKMCSALPIPPPILSPRATRPPMAIGIAEP